jgi:hypothetical protein
LFEIALAVKQAYTHARESFERIQQLSPEYVAAGAECAVLVQ